MSAVPLRQTDAAVASTVARARREHVRWLCLLYLDQVRPATMTDSALAPMVRADYPDADAVELRRALDYLDSRGLLSITKDGARWHLRLSYQGVDLVEYTSPDVPGIGRPPV